MATPSLGRARGRRCCHGRPAWSVLLIRLLVLLLALLLWTPAAEGRWAGKDEAPKKTCRNARLQVSAPASAAGPLSVNPGEAFPIVLRVPRRACRQDKGMNCTIVARLADGLFLAGPKAVAKAAVSTDLPDFSRTITWSLATLQAAATATATAAEPPQQAKKRPRAKYQEYTFKLAADACAAPLNLAMSLQLVRSKASRRRGQKTVCRTPAVAVKVLVQGGLPGPVDYSLKRSCAIPGCQLCSDDGRQCQKCMNSWRTDGQGRCECAAGAGSFADLTYANLPAQSRGFPTTQPDGVTCAHRYYDPRTRNGSRVKGHCDTRNPRVLQHLHLDAPGCQCWTCPPGWTSDGGQASVTFCYPTVLPRYLKVEVEVNTAPPNVSVPPPFDSTNLSTADSIFTSLATTMSAPPRSVAAAQDGVSKWVGPVQRFGAVQRDTRDPAAAASYSSSYFIEGTNHRAVSVFATILTVNAAASAVATAVDAARQACMHLTGGPTACAACRNATGWDICGAVADGGMVASRPPHVLRFALSEVHRPALGHEPRKNPLATPSALALQSPMRRRLLNGLFLNLASFLSSFGQQAGKGWTQYNNAVAAGNPFSWGTLSDVVGAVVGGAFQVIGIAMTIYSLFNPPAPTPDPDIPYLQQINQTTLETLQDVQELQGQVQAISQTVGMLGRLLNVDFSIVECQTAQNAYSSIMGSLEGAWQSYAGFTVNGEDVTDATTILPLLQSYLQLIPQRAYLSPSNWNDVAAIIDQWANSVLTGQALFNEVIEFGQFLLGAGQYDDSAIVTCAQAAFNKWQTAGAVSPYDDRQYYGSISAWLLGLITLQVQSGFILQQANLWMAQSAYFAGLPQPVSNATLAATLNPGFCYAALTAEPGTPLGAATLYCKNYFDQTQAIYNSIITQIETLGWPLSFGDAPGEGARLVLGSDILGVQGYFVNATSNAETTQNPGLVSTATTYLVAAGAPAFDPNCQSADVATAVASGCSTVSTFNGCGTGCGVNPTQEALWAGVGQGQFGTYNTTLWQSGESEVWTQLRGMATTLVPDTAVGDAGDTMALLEQNTSIFNSVPGVVPFGGMMDRLYWITNSYAYTSMREISLGTYYPGVLDFTPTNVWEAIVQGYYTFSDDPLPYFAVTTTTAARSPASGSGGPMPFIPSIEFPGSQCFAGYNPTNVTGTGTIGRNSGTSGVFCSWLDFPAIFNQDCVVPGNNYLCNEAWYCTQQVNANMISTFGNAGVGASSGASGYFEAACVWEPFGNTGDGGAVFNANVNVVPKGECMLVPQGWQNEYYAASNCANAATSGGSKAVQGIPAAELVVEGLPQTTVAHRIRPFGCAGGSQANWAYGGGVFFYPQCSTNFCNCPFSFRVGDDDDDDDDSLTYGWTYDPWFCPMQQDCLQAFSFPWFPTISSPDQGNWPAGTWIPPNDSLTRQYFVLPTLDIATRQCTPSPFVYASIPPNARQQLATWATANIPVPTQCGVDLTQSIVQIISAGPYAADSGSSYAELTLAADNRTASCTYQWVGAPPGVITVNVTISVRDGPIFASDDLLTSGSEESPGWQSQTFYNSTIDVYAALPTTARNFTRVVVCAVQGLDPATLLPLYLTSQPQVILAPGQGWQNFTYPLPDPPTTAPTKRPTRHPSQHPTVHPTVTPSQQPATGSRSI